MPMAKDSNGGSLQAAQYATVQQVAIGATSVQSSAFASLYSYGSRAVRLCATVDCYLLFGTSPTVTTGTGVFFPAGIVEYVAVSDAIKLAVIAASAGTTGILSVTEII